MASINWNTVFSSLLSIAQNAPSYIGAAATVISEAENIYNEVKDNFSTTDQSTLDAAFAAAKSADSASTSAADAALDAASKA